MQTQIREEVDKYRIVDFSEQTLNSNKRERQRCKTQYYQVKAAVQREHETRQKLDKTRHEYDDLETHCQKHTAEILELEARKFEDDKTISELRREVQGLRKELKSSQQQQRQESGPDEVGGCRNSQRCKRRKDRLKKVRAQRNVLREELEGVRNEGMMELEKAVEREEPYLLGVFRLMRQQIDDLREKNSRLVENWGLICRATT